MTSTQRTTERRFAPKATRTLQGLMLEQQSAMDELMGELACGLRSAAHYDALEEKADAFCAGVRAAFRDCRIERS